MWVNTELQVIVEAKAKKPEASDDIALWLADEFTQVSGRSTRALDRLLS